MATTEPKVISKMIAAAIRPMPSDPAATVWDLVATAPPTSTWSDLVTGREDGRDQRLGLVGRELVGCLVEGDVGVRRGAVGRDLVGAVRGEGAGDAHDMLGVGDLGEDRLDAVSHLGRGHAGVGVDDDLDRVARPSAGSGPRACSRPCCDSEPGWR